MGSQIRNTLFFLGLIALLAIPAVAAAGGAGYDTEAGLSENAASRAAAVSGPLISVEPLTLDFGIVTIGTTGNREYAVRNTGDADLEITGIASSDPQITTQQPIPTTLRPGESLVGSALYAPTGGALNATLSFQSDASNGTFTILATGQANHAPVLDPIADIAAIANLPIEFAVHATDLDADPVILSADGLPPSAKFDDGTGAFSWKPTVDDGGAHAVTFTASDGHATTSITVTITVSVLNLPPIPDPGGPYAGIAGQPVSFDGSGSSDPEGSALAFHWSFGDGGTASEERPTHIYGSAAIYTVTLEVVDTGIPDLSATAFTLATISDETSTSDQVTLLATRDNTIYSESDSSYGGGTCLQVGRPSQSTDVRPLIRRALLRFDLSSIPPGSRVVSARLNMYRYSLAGPGIQFRVHRLLQDWGEGTSGDTQGCTPPPKQFGRAPGESSSTWNYRFYGPGLRWQTESGAPSPGGYFRATPSDDRTISTADQFLTVTSADITSDVADWVRDPASNFGWIIRGDEEVAGTGMRFASRQDTLPSHPPSLTVFFKQPTGACCLPDGTCDLATPEECHERSGVYGGDGSTCDQLVCLEPYVDWLPIPPVAAPVRGRAGGAAYYEIAMKEFQQKLHRDLPPTTLWGYDGQYPGPTIEASRNQPVQVRWINDLRDYETGLPRAAHYFDVDTRLHGPDMMGKTPRTVVHLHGGHVPPEFDGYPESTFVWGGSRLYRYPNRQLPTTLWYHDHALGITRYNVMLGLAGLYLIRDRNEEALSLPSGSHEIPLVIQDRSFHPDGSLDYPDEWMPMFIGDKVLVNGKVWPKLRVDRGKYRFRVLNGSNHRTFTLALSDRRPFHVIGSDGGLLSAPVEVGELSLGPAERADLVFDFEGYAPDSEVLLLDTLASGQADPSDPASPRIMKFVVSGDPGWTEPLPHSLSGDVERIPERQATRTRTFELKFDQRLQQFRFGDFGWEDLTDFPTLGSTEIWQFANETTETHPIHVHLIQFQVLDRSSFEVVDGVVVPGTDRRPPDLEEAGWKDTAKVKPRELLRVIMRFGPDGYLGDYVYHCHMLEHEDNEMMRQFRVVPPSGRKPTVESAKAEPARLWPPDLAMVPVRITGVTDSSGAPAAVHVTRVTQDEPISSRDGVGACADAEVRNGQLYLRRERRDGGNGRVYRVSFTAVTREGGVADGVVSVRVPGKEGVRLAADDGQVYNSLEGCTGRGGRAAMAPKGVGGAGIAWTTSLASPRVEGARAVVEYTLAEPGEVTLNVFDVAGRRVATLAGGMRGAGPHRSTLELRRLAHGIYFVKMQAGGKVLTRRMPVLRTGG